MAQQKEVTEELLSVGPKNHLEDYEIQRRIGRMYS